VANAVERTLDLGHVEQQDQLGIGILAPGKRYQVDIALVAQRQIEHNRVEMTPPGQTQHPLGVMATLDFVSL
jgi:hypothetical protein